MALNALSPQFTVHEHAIPGVRPFAASIPQEAVHDLQLRLDMLRWPEIETVTDWSQGVPRARLQALVEQWRRGYDWSRAEAKLNAFPQFVTAIDGLDIHFIHVRSPHADALPIILTHGWPGSVFELLDVVAALADPTAFGGSAEQAFHVVIASLPGCGFSARPVDEGWGTTRIAEAWSTLMARLGYSKWVAHGAGLGADVTLRLAALHAAGLAAIHLVAPEMAPPSPANAHDADEHAAWEAYHAAAADQYAYLKLQQTRPQTLGYALADSPLALAAWMAEKLWTWSGHTSVAEPPHLRDAFLDSIALHWLTGSGSSAARMYAESAGPDTATANIAVPVAVASYPREPARMTRRWAMERFPTLHSWRAPAKGSRFAALEEPAGFAAMLSHAFAIVR